MQTVDVVDGVFRVDVAAVADVFYNNCLRPMPVRGTLVARAPDSVHEFTCDASAVSCSDADQWTVHHARLYVEVEPDGEQVKVLRVSAQKKVPEGTFSVTPWPPPGTSTRKYIFH